jgi:hypothetical protein
VESLEIRHHDRNPNLWWVSSHGNDVAYITHPGKAYVTWAVSSAAVGFTGKSFETVDAAVAALAQIVSSIPV